MSKSTFRRPHTQAQDGPFPLRPGDSSTRVKQIAKTLAVPSSGADPGQYDYEHAKDWCMRNPRVGAYMSRTKRAGPAPRQVADSLSVALAHGYTWVDRATLGPAAVSQIGHHNGSDAADGPPAPPRMAEGHALPLPPWHPSARAAAAQTPVPFDASGVDAFDEEHGFHMSAEGRAQLTESSFEAHAAAALGVLDDVHTDSAHVVAAGLAGKDVTDVAPTAPVTCATLAPLGAGGRVRPEPYLDHGFAGHVTAAAPARPRPFVPPKAPPIAVARSAAHCADPGDWDWGASARALCNTFTMQDGGAFQRDRARADMSRDPLDKHGGAHSQSPTRDLIELDCEAGAHEVEAQSRGECESGREEAEGSGLGTNTLCAQNAEGIGARRGASARDQSEASVQQRRGRATPKMVASDAKAKARHEAAEVSAAAAHAVRARQARWQMQSALLPVLKRDALLEAHAARTEAESIAAVHGDKRE